MIANIHLYHATVSALSPRPRIPRWRTTFVESVWKLGRARNYCKPPDVT
ncbi:hypothetical protein [Agromyces bracchium]|uniref:Uncharacterized protein n=1 Tax=Agromyces bracchium TaxID=88376 RepID=A0A6I3MDZ0_9MICO|nr:hypothetical protein [Agromyces bracchium]MTH70402.1 hypothetical protein [Agromyces bracchium]